MRQICHILKFTFLMFFHFSHPDARQRNFSDLALVEVKIKKSRIKGGALHSRRSDCLFLRSSCSRRRKAAQGQLLQGQFKRLNCGDAVLLGRARRRKICPRKKCDRPPGAEHFSEDKLRRARPFRHGAPDFGVFTKWKLRLSASF